MKLGQFILRSFMLASYFDSLQCSVEVELKNPKFDIKIEPQDILWYFYYCDGRRHNNVASSKKRLGFRLSLMS